MPNGAQTSTEEEEGSGGESPEEWDSDADDDDEDDDSDEEEEEEEGKLHLPTRKDARSLSMTPRLSVVRGSRPLPSRPSALGLLLRRQLRRL